MGDGPIIGKVETEETAKPAETGSDRAPSPVFRRGSGNRVGKRSRGRPVAPWIGYVVEHLAGSGISASMRPLPVAVRFFRSPVRFMRRGRRLDRTGGGLPRMRSQGSGRHGTRFVRMCRMQRETDSIRRRRGAGGVRRQVAGAGHCLQTTRTSGSSGAFRASAGGAAGRPPVRCRDPRANASDRFYSSWLQRRWRAG